MVDCEGVIRRNGNLVIPVRHQQLPQTKGVYSKITAPESPLDDHLPEARGTEEETVRFVQQEGPSGIGELVWLAGRPEDDMGVQK
jgi:hypothetical protein